MTSRPIGWQITSTYCLQCAPEGLRDYHPPILEGEDFGVPYVCDQCGKDGSALVLTLDDGETISLSTEEVVAYLRDSGLLDHVRLVA